MAKATVAKVIEEIKSLTRAEQQQVREMLEELPAAETLTDDEKRKQLFEQLYAEGIIDKIPNRTRRLAALDHPPIPIQGKPLSETVIEERR